MRYFIIAGEASGDLHGSHLMKALKEADSEAGFCFFGGDLMLAQGGRLLKHYREMAFMGAIDVVVNIRSIARNMNLCKSELIDFKPDVVILIDYPGFNIKIAEFAHQHNFRVFWFIAPKVWAWKAWRVKKLSAFVDELFTIFPFETEFFQRHHMKVNYVGNPLVDSIADSSLQFRDHITFITQNHLSDKPLVALLPGSRSQEIKLMLPVMSRLAAEYPGFQFVISGTSAVASALYEKYSVDRNIRVITGQTYEILHHAFAAVVTSGTATLETALLNVPQVVLYKMMGGKIGYRVFRYLFLKVKYVSLPNLILNREAVKEFVMDEMNFEKVKPEVDKLLNDRAYRQNIFGALDELKQVVGGPGAAKYAAILMVQLLNSYKTGFNV